MADQDDLLSQRPDGSIKIQQFYMLTFRVVSSVLPMSSVIDWLGSNRMVRVLHRKLKKSRKLVNIEHYDFFKTNFITLLNIFQLIVKVFVV